MNTNAFQDDHEDPVWDLLGKAKAVEVSPFFARNVLREIRLAQTQTPPSFRTERGIRSLLYGRWRMAFTACAAACIVAATSTVLYHDHENALALRSRDAEVISNLDELLTYDNSTVWNKKPLN